ncbi:stemmadenine O-acetyltransferase-like [Cornus florida]|uniref:stemmadenine O-acetyltransferase-like n=1 Tax=Cornus florida TaxID=4283 RepID=UPI002899A886|nr:stemmadenine O-acetyltransferase-like [Cornus florida]
MKVEIISEETIKPSSSTPYHLRNLNLSFLDQLAPPTYVPLLLFYHADDCNKNIDLSQRSCLLKKSLANCLTHFYPLAGTLREYSFIDCNDEGVKYLETRVPCKLIEVTESPNEKVLNQLLPFEPCHGKTGSEGEEVIRPNVKVLNPMQPFEPCHEKTGSEREVLLAVQFNEFVCGGLAVGVCISHKIADGSSAVTFVDTWAALSRGSASMTIHPSFDAATLFPPRDIMGFRPDIALTKDNIATKRFVFDKTSIEVLKQQASSLGVKAPTRVEVVSALIWRRFMALSRSKTEPVVKVCAVLHAVNLRERMVPPLSKHYFGNVWRVAISPSTIENEEEHHMLVDKLRNAIREVDNDYIKKLVYGNGYMDFLKNACQNFHQSEIMFCNFTSWCRFPVYEVDFGWGKPNWVCSPYRPFKNVVILMSTRDGYGIEAWVNMLKEDMDIFEHDPELLSFVSSTVSG